ncbi:ECF RNA polymerase sigma factor SigK [Arthrobacter sp. HLT1-21]
MSANTGDTLVELLYKTGQGNEEAFTLFYRNTAGRVHGLARRVIRDPDLSSDTSQEVYLQVWRTAALYDPSVGSPMAWLMMITHRRAVDRVRSEQSATNRAARYGVAVLVTDYDCTVETVMHRVEVESVVGCLKTLTSMQRESIQLAYYGGLTYREVAETLGVPLSTVKSRIKDGLLRLKTCMGVS